MEHLGNHYSVLLHDADLRRPIVEDEERSAARGAPLIRPLRRRGSVAAIAAVAACALGAVLVFVPVGSSAQVETEVPANIELAHAFTAALNAHDVEALVDLFTEDDSGPTVNADAYAWQKYEIRLWARQQAAANFHAEAYDFRVTDNGAAWNADVFRDDWQEWGVSLLPVANAIWIHDGKVADFTSILRDPRDAERLSGLWRPNTGVRP